MAPALLKILVSISFLFLTSKAYPFAEKPQNLVKRQDASPQARFQQVRNSIIEAGFEFVQPQSFFAVSGECKTDVRSIDRRKWVNRFAYYKQAIRDATQIAHGAQKWPQLGTDASDLYMFKGLGEDQNQGHALNITRNIAAAADWEHPRWGFDPYITLTCNDPFGICQNKVGSDPRSIACYVNNTYNLWSSISQISCCGPFFTAQDNKEAFEYGKSKDINKLSLDWMRTSGSYLLHEMMHTFKITHDRPHVKDQEFDGERKRRVYGPKDCAKAARGKTNIQIAEATTNADSYAEFMLAMYWKDLFNGKLLPPTGKLAIEEAPAGVDQGTGEFALVSDNDQNYAEFAAYMTQPQLSCAGEPADKPPSSQAWITAQIDDYCTHTTNANWIVNSTTGVHGPKGYAAGNTSPESDNDLWISIRHDPDCDVNTGYEVELGRCKDLFGMALNGCNTNSVTKKWGGQVQANCALWNITTRAGHDSTPP